MVQGLRAHAGGEIRDQGHAQASHAHMLGGDDLLYRRHAHQLGPHVPEGPHFCRSFVGGAQDTDVHPFLKADSQRFSLFPEEAAQRRIVGIFHARELDSPRRRQGTEQGIRSGEVDVIAEHHQIPGFEGWIEASRGVRHQKKLSPEQASQPNHEDHLVAIVALVTMDPAPLVDDRHTGKRLDDLESVGVADDPMDRKGKDFLEGPRADLGRSEIDGQTGSGDDQGFRRGPASPMPGFDGGF